MIKAEMIREKLLDIEKLKYCYSCGICTASCPMMELLPNHYNPRSLLLGISTDLERVLTEYRIWLCAWCYRCHERCPQGVSVPEVLTVLKDVAAERGYLGGLVQALEIIKRELPLPAACCYTCLHPERGNVPRPSVPDVLKRFVDDYLSEIEKEEIPPKTREEEIAIVGSGPGGLTAAQGLALKGFPVTIFESMSEPGGMLRKCIPEYRLSKSIIDIEVKRIERLGGRLRTNVTIGKELSIDDLLREGYKAVFVATGAHKSRRLGVEGENMRGVFHALDFLEGEKFGKRREVGDRVAIIGGGNSAIDAARVALRLGAREVCIFYRRSREEMPANPWEVREAENEGVKFQLLVAPKRIFGKGGHVAGVEFVRMRLGRPDESGRKRPIEIPGSEFVMEFDTVILAIGETPDLSYLPAGIEVVKGTISVDPFTLETSMPPIFAGGDVVTGPATVIEAIVAGKRAAASIADLLSSLKKLKGD